jgi:hypothetical protein
MKYSRLEADEQPSRSRVVQFVLVALLALAVVAVWTPIILLTVLRLSILATVRAARRLAGPVFAKPRAVAGS